MFNTTITGKKLLVILATAFFFFIPSLNAQEVPVLDRDLFFGNPEISGAQISPDGQWISFLKVNNGTMNIWVKKFDEPFEKAHPLTNSTRPLYGYFWTFDSKYILFVKDNNGDENINVYAVDPAGKAAEGGVPESRNLTPKKEVAAQIYTVSRNNPDLLMVGLNDRDKAWHDLYSLQISTGELKLLYKNTDRVTGYNFDWDDNLRILQKTDDKGNTVFLRTEGNNAPVSIYEINVSEQASIQGWNENNTAFYLETNKGKLNLSELYLMNPSTKELKKVESDPKKLVDFGGLMLNQNTRKIITTTYTDDKTRYYWKDKTFESYFKFLRTKFPGREFNLQSSTKDYKKILVTVWGDKYASDTYLFNTDTKELIHQYTPRPKLKEVEKYLAPMQAVKYKSSDGLVIPGYLTIPQGKKAKNLPLVVLVHGGPKGPRDYWGYNAYAQFLANRGYAVLLPNFRASGGYGKKFLNAGDLQWGKLMQDDITWGVKYLVSKGIVDKNKVAIMGGSYGGYATLAGLAFTPDLYACGVDIVGPSNLFTLLESIPAYWESFRTALYKMTGDPNTEEGKKRIKESSPLFHADKINKPLLIVQGANDPRVKKAEADQIVIALRDKGKQVSYLLADDEGHGFQKPVNNMAMFAEIEKFLAPILGGRFQSEMPADVEKRLNELRVDISKVTYTPNTATAAGKLPAIKNEFKELSLEYDVLLEVQGQKIPMTSTRTVKQKGNNWLVKDDAKSIMGGMVDEVEYTADFKPVSRNVSQMGQTFASTYGAEKVIVTAAGRNMEIEVKGTYMSEGAGIDAVIAGLPLAEGYTLSFYLPEMMRLSMKLVNLKVEGTESINSKNCHKISIVNSENENDRMTLWIDPATKITEKMVVKSPAMGNGSLTVTRK